MAGSKMSKNVKIGKLVQELLRCPYTGQSPDIKFSKNVPKQVVTLEREVLLPHPHPHTQ